MTTTTRTYTQGQIQDALDRIATIITEVSDPAEIVERVFTTRTSGGQAELQVVPKDADYYLLVFPVPQPTGSPGLRYNVIKWSGDLLTIDGSHGVEAAQRDWVIGLDAEAIAEEIVKALR